MSYNFDHSLNNNLKGILPSSNDPFFQSLFVSLGSYNYLIGAILMLLVILCCLWYPKARRKAAEYKKRQLVEYNKNRPKEKDVTDYHKTKLYLPMREKAKLSAPIIFGVMFLFMSITFFVGYSLTTL